MKIPTLKSVYDQTTTEAVSDSYPYGRLHCTAKWWIEDKGKKGMRVMFQTVNPKTNRVNNPKASTYDMVKILFLDENGHVKSDGIHGYITTEKCEEFVNKYDLREEDEKFLRAYITHKKKVDAAFAAKPIKFVITERPMYKITG